MDVVNISKSSAMIDDTTLRKCDYKCSYSFRYPETNLTAINNGNQLTLKLDTYRNAAAKFNGKDYTVNAVYIFCPSVHIINNGKAAAEVIVEHVPLGGGTYFYVCIPVLNGNDTLGPLAEIINRISVQANESGESINFNKTDFTLQNLVPMKPYFFYEGVFGTSSANFIVYDFSAALFINNETYTNLKNTIKDSPLAMLGGPISYNANGPDNKMKGDLYISCRPVNVSKDTVKVINQKTGSSSQSPGLDSKTKQMIVQSFIILAMIVLVIGIMYGASRLFSGEPIKLTNPFSKTTS